MVEHGHTNTAHFECLPKKTKLTCTCHRRKSFNNLMLVTGQSSLVKVHEQMLRNTFKSRLASFTIIILVKNQLCTLNFITKALECKALKL